MSDVQRCREQIRLLLRRGFVDEAAQRATLFVDEVDAPRARATAAFHFIGLAVRYATQESEAAALESFDAALDLIAEASTHEDLRPRMYQNIGAALNDSGDHVGAAECFEVAIRLGATSPAVWLELGRARLRADDAAAALDALAQAQALRPSAAVTAEIALARLALQATPDRAREMLVKLAASRPEHESVRRDYALGRAHALAGDRAAAVAAYRRALERADGELSESERALAAEFVKGDA